MALTLLPVRRLTQQEFVNTIDAVEQVLTEMVHDWEGIPAEIRDRLNVECRAPLLTLLIRSQRRGVIRPAQPQSPSAGGI